MISASGKPALRALRRGMSVGLLGGLLFATPVSGADDITELLARLEGLYSSAGVAQPSGLDERQLENRPVVVAAPELGEYVMYWQKNSGPDRRVYRQRLLVFQPAEEAGKIRQVTWSLAAPEKFIDAWNSSELFFELTEKDLWLELAAACDQFWKRRGDDWHGRVDPGACRIWSERRQAWREIEGEAPITPDQYLTTERGFDANGRQVFGTGTGTYHALDRR
jgi:hypothetical protein